MSNYDGQAVTCIACKRSEKEVPVTEWRLDGRSFWVCPDCLPRLIHHRTQAMTQWGVTTLPAPEQGGGSHA